MGLISVWTSLPALIRFMIRNALIGFSIGVCSVLLMAYFDIGHLGSTIGRAGNSWLPLGVLAYAMGLSFGGVQISFAVLLMPWDDSEDEGGKPQRVARDEALTPIPVPVSDPPAAQRRGFGD